MAGLVTTKDLLDPCYHLVGRGVGRLIQIEETRGDIVLDISLKGRATLGMGSVVVAAHIELVEVLERYVFIKQIIDKLGMHIPEENITDLQQKRPL